MTAACHAAVEKSHSDVESSGSSIPNHLKPTLNVFQGAALIAGATIGSGKVLGVMGATGPSLFLWVLAAVVAFVAAMNYAELGSRITQSGGDAPYLESAYPRPRKFLAVIFSWTRVVLVNPGYNSSLSYIAATYLAEAFPDALSSTTNSLRTIATIILVVQTLACIPSNNVAGKFVAGVTVVSVLSLALFCITGMGVLVGIAPSVRTLDSFSSEHLFKGTTSNPGEWANALFKVLWAFDGFANLASSLGELRNPERNIKRATVLGIGTVTFLYLLANVTYLVSVPFDLLSTQGDKIASVWAERVFGAGGRVAVTLIIAVSVLSCCYVCLFSASRIAQATGESAMIFPPRFFAALNGKTGTPVNALMVNLIMSIALLWIPPNDDVFWFVINLVSYPTWFFYGLTSIALLIIKRRDAANGYAGVTMHPAGAVFVLLMALFLVVFPYFDPTLVLPSALAWVFMFLGIPSWFLLMRQERMAKDAVLAH
ncbi:amino acid/polyamine transporter I [Catenaria anguillulae PL171]|uniref:Amino acid/polyamine transporter I n=1 Tax=Catenaria anguillulae PL171 TaxID=765915 RepID=A0A1Y2HEP9_9FUNG|nr:amino acid/polyamine transporter I [Catenaria anguillulae PL171]